MICSAYFGCLSEKRKWKWDNDDSNPYEVLVAPIPLEGKGQKVLDAGSKYFREQIQIDWGSFAWKCTPEEIYSFLCDHRTTLPWLDEREANMEKNVREYIAESGQDEFGVVFIEES